MDRDGHVSWRPGGWPGVHIYSLGAGVGSSVLYGDVVNAAYAKPAAEPVNYHFAPRPRGEATFSLLGGGRP